MSTGAKSYPAVVWHHRVLGTFWTLFGLTPVMGVATNFSATGLLHFVEALACSAVCVGISIGFFFGRTWARRIMFVLMLITALCLLDMLLMFGWCGNREGVWLTTASLGVNAYTLLFLVISARRPSKQYPE